MINRGLRSASRDLPADEDDFVPLTTFLLVLKVIDSPPTLSLWEGRDEIIVVGGCARLFDDDLGGLFVEVVDDVLVFVTKLEFLECGETASVEPYAG